MQSFKEKTFYKLIVVALSIGLTAPVMARNIKIDVVRLESMANEGNSFAQKMMGDMYSHTDLAKSFAWYEKAAKQNDTLSQHNLGVMYENGTGVRQDYKMAKEWYGKACDNGEQSGCNNYRRLNN